VETDRVTELVPLRRYQHHTTPALGPITDPLKYSVQYSWATFGVGVWTSIHSVTKSARAYDLLVVRGTYFMS
jgi:hypothetical protein